MAVSVSTNLTKVTISSAGVQGPKGETGESGLSADISSLVTTSSFNEFTSSYTTDSASFASRIESATNEQDLSNLATTGSNSFIGDQQITGSVYIDITDSDKRIYFSINGDTNTYMGTTMGSLTFTDGAGYIQLDAQNQDGSGNYAYLTLNANNDNTLFFAGDNTPGRVNASINLSTSGSFNISTNDNTATLLLDGISYDAHLVSTSSFNTFTASAATLGANTFNGNQTINGSIILDNDSVIKDNANQSISFGVDAAESGQGVQSTAIGSNAGQTDQGNGATAIGVLAGNLEQGQSAVSVGALAGSTQQGDWAIAIGTQAGGISQGDYSIAIGNLAGALNQAPNSIVISALGSTLENTTTSSLKIAPIRNISGGDGLLQYNNTTKEVSYSNQFTGSLHISGSGITLNENTNLISTIDVGGYIYTVTLNADGLSFVNQSNDIMDIATGPGGGSINAKAGKSFSITTDDNNNLWFFNNDGDLSVAGNVNNAPNLATTGSNQFNGNQTITGSLNISGSNSIVVLPNHSTAPTSPPSGALYFNTTDFHFYGWNGGQWTQLDN